jgi:hypothetical protein
MLSASRQKELADVVERLAAFQPTKVCVERMPGEQESLDAEYARYLEARAQPDPDEVSQIGFRLARRCGLNRIYAIDADKMLDWDGLTAYFKTHPDEEKRFTDNIAARQAQAREVSKDLPNIPIAQLLREANREDALADNLRFYVDLAGLGGLGEHGGADYAASWYRRNFRIFSNLCSMSGPGDRLFVVIGAGHVPILRHLVKLSSRHRLVDVTSFLP